MVIVVEIAKRCVSVGLIALAALTQRREHGESMKYETNRDMNSFAAAREETMRGLLWEDL